MVSLWVIYPKITDTDKKTVSRSHLPHWLELYGIDPALHVESPISVVRAGVFKDSELIVKALSLKY